MAFGKWTAVVGGIIAIVGAIVTTNWVVYVGGAVAIIGGLASS